MVNQLSYRQIQTDILQRINTATDSTGLAVRGLMKVYPDPASDKGIVALRNIEMDVTPGDFVSIIGPSGAGKSTLLNLLGGLDSPTAGEIWAGNIPVHSIKSETKMAYRQKIVGILWQSSERNLLPSLSVRENIEFVLRIANYEKLSFKQRIDQLLKQVGLSERKHHKPNQLSGGEAQRAGLAVALAAEPKILLADEPTGELDSETTMEVISYLQSINEEFGTTLIIVTHDNRFERMTKRTYNILDGQISGVRRSVSGAAAKNWREAIREELAYVDQYGNVKIPKEIRDKVGIGSYVRFLINEKEELTIIPADKEVESK